MKTNKLTFVLLMVLVTITTKAQRADRFTGSRPLGAPKVISANDFTDKTRELRLAIDSLSSGTGGNIELRGRISLSQVSLKSNIHINIRKGTIIKLDPTGSSMFDLATKVDSEKIENVRFYCSDCSNDVVDNDNPRERYTIDISSIAPNKNANVWKLGKVKNFSISHFYVIDNYTKINAIAYSAVIRDNTGEGIMHDRDLQVLGAPRQGDVKYGHMINAHSGYGLVQTQAGKNLNFHHLSSEGGVTLRLESGAVIANIPTDEQPIGDLDDIEGYDIRCKNGYASALLSPHGRSQGVVQLENIISEGCNANILFATGFQDRDVSDIADFPNDRFKRGTFAEVILKGDIFHRFGNRAQTEKKYFGYYPSCIRENKSFDEKFLSKRHKAPYPETETDKAKINAPSMANILYKARKGKEARIDKVEGEYLVRFDEANFRTDGFNRSIGNITYSGDKNNIVCTTSRGSMKSSSSQIDLNTSSEEQENNLYVNASSKTLHAKVASSVMLYVFDISGRLVKTSQVNEGNEMIDISDLQGGMYFAKFKLNGKVLTTKFYI